MNAANIKAILTIIESLSYYYLTFKKTESFTFTQIQLELIGFAALIISGVKQANTIDLKFIVFSRCVNYSTDNFLDFVVNWQAEFVKLLSIQLF